jgi:hypothetical protein
VDLDELGELTGEVVTDIRHGPRDLGGVEDTCRREKCCTCSPQHVVIGG